MITPEQLPRHACGCYLSHNAHKDSYTPIVDYVYGETDANMWRNAEAMKRAVDTNEVWELQWYPDTPIGFIRVYAPTLPELLAWAAEQGARPT